MPPKKFVFIPLPPPNARASSTAVNPSGGDASSAPAAASAGEIQCSVEKSQWLVIQRAACAILKAGVLADGLTTTTSCAVPDLLSTGQQHSSSHHFDISPFVAELGQLASPEAYPVIGGHVDGPPSMTYQDAYLLVFDAASGGRVMPMGQGFPVAAGASSVTQQPPSVVSFSMTSRTADQLSRHAQPATRAVNSLRELMHAAANVLMLRYRRYVTLSTPPADGLSVATPDVDVPIVVDSNVHPPPSFVDNDDGESRQPQLRVSTVGCLAALSRSVTAWRAAVSNLRHLFYMLEHPSPPSGQHSAAQHQQQPHPLPVGSGANGASLLSLGGGTIRRFGPFDSIELRIAALTQCGGGGGGGNIVWGMVPFTRPLFHGYADLVFGQVAADHLISDDPSQIRAPLIRAALDGYLTLADDHRSGVLIPTGHLPAFRHLSHRMLRDVKVQQQQQQQQRNGKAGWPVDVDEMPLHHPPLPGSPSAHSIPTVNRHEDENAGRSGTTTTNLRSFYFDTVAESFIKRASTYYGMEALRVSDEGAVTASEAAAPTSGSSADATRPGEAPVSAAATLDKLVAASVEAQFVQHCLRRVDEEQRRASLFLDPESFERLEEAVDTHLLVPFLPSVLETGMPLWLKSSGGSSSMPRAASSVASCAVTLGATIARIAFQLCNRPHVQLGDEYRKTFRATVHKMVTEIVAFAGAAPTAAGSAPSTASSATAPPPPATPAGGSNPSAAVIPSLIELKEHLEGTVMTIDRILSGHAGVSSFGGATAGGVFASFFMTVREAFDMGLRPKQNKIGELLAKHLDSFLRDGQQRTEAEVEAAVETAMKFFTVVPAKDVFEAFYCKDFARRLLAQRCASMDAERYAIAKLKEILGGSTAQHLEGMMRDMETSAQLSQGYAEQRASMMETVRATSSIDFGDLAARTMSSDQVMGVDAAEEESGMQPTRSATFPTEHPVAVAAAAASVTPATPTGVGNGAPSPTTAAVDFTVNVLTTTYWPSFMVVDVALPALMRHHSDAFVRFYRDKHKSRRLVWCHVLATSVIKGYFNTCRKDFTVSMLQALILNGFNDKPSQTLLEIKAALQLRLVSSAGAPGGGASAPGPASSSSASDDRTELIAALISLTAGNARVLRRARSTPLQPGGAAAATAITDIADADTFHFAADFTHKLQRIRVNQVQLRDNAEESTATYEKVFADRQHVVDAAIVRFMKSRRTATHTDLVSEVTGMLKFPVLPADMKKRIEHLIERDFLSRDDKSPNVYQYVA